jgi:hypothetical protein
MFKSFRSVAITTVAFLCTASVMACNVPVFRYALERWQNDLYHVVVFHKGDLSAEDKQRVENIRLQSTLLGGTANFEVTTVDVAGKLEPGLADLWKTAPEDAALPFVLLQARMGREKTLTVWEGPLSDVNVDRLTSSPDRKEIVNRLLKGHSAVWVVLPGKDELTTHNTVNLIETELNRLQDELPLPEGIGQPGSEVYSEIPLTLRFSVLVLKTGPEADALLPEMMRRIAPGAAAEGQPLVMPVFGRGRAVDVIPGDKVDEGTVEDLSRFICGACSCQVKEQNPGFDLLMSVPWNERLFTPDLLPPKDTPKRQKAPELVAIPSGAKVSQTAASLPANLTENRSTEAKTLNEQKRDATVREEPTNVSAMLGLMILVVAAFGLAAYSQFRR